MPTDKTAVIYRMVMKEHICPFGLKARYLLSKAGYRIDDHWLTSRQETDEFQRHEQVETTPQVYIDGKRIGGYDEVRNLLGKGPAQSSPYRPVVTVFIVALLIAMAAAYVAFGTVFTARTVTWTLAIIMTILAMLKLQDIEQFSNMFLGYDLLAQRYVPYAYAYPFGEALAGLLMIAGVGLWLAAPVAFFLGLVGAVSVFKAVYIDKRSLKCACVGGDSKVPLGFVSLTENLIMIAMAIWMLAGSAG